MPLRTTDLLGFLNVFSTVGMAWWVSSTALCAAVLSGIWRKRDEVRSMTPWVRHNVFALVLLFFMSIVAFGAMSAIGSFFLGRNLEDACSAVTAAGGCNQADAFWMRRLMIGGFAIGTTSFIACTVAWIVAWVVIGKGHAPIQITPEGTPTITTERAQHVPPVSTLASAEPEVVRASEWKTDGPLSSENE